MQARASERVSRQVAELPQKVSHSGGLHVTFSLHPLEDFDGSSMVVEAVDSVDGLYKQFGGRCVKIRGVLTPEECDYLVVQMGHVTVPVKYPIDYRRNDRCIFESQHLAEILWRRVGPVVRDWAVSVDVDNAKQHFLSEYECFVEAAKDMEEAGDCPEELRLGYGAEGIWRPESLNECLRFCRYDPGGFSRAHCDASFQRSEDEQSLFTCMFYLDGEMLGGATRFIRLDHTIDYGSHLKPAADDQVLASITPEPGLCLLFFQQGLLHEGTDLLQGVKHILRTEVMCRRESATKPQRTPQQIEAMELLQQAKEAENKREFKLSASLYQQAFRLDSRLERLC